MSEKVHIGGFNPIAEEAKSLFHAWVEIIDVLSPTADSFIFSKRAKEALLHFQALIRENLLTCDQQVKYQSDSK